MTGNPRQVASGDRHALSAWALAWPRRLHGLPPAVLRGLVPPRRLGVLVIGMSHTRALAEALAAAPDPRVGVLNVRTAKERIRQLEPPLMARYRPDVVVSVLGGAHHHLLGLVEGDEAFDFEFAGGPPPLPGRRLIPQAEIRAMLAEHMDSVLEKLTLLRRWYGRPTAHLSAPPPIADEAHIARYLGVMAQRHGLNPQLTPRPVRMKLYQVQNAILREHCRQNDIAFIEAPAGALDAEGFLAPAYRRNDPVHGNARYGHLALGAVYDFAAAHGVARPVGATVAAPGGAAVAPPPEASA